MGGLVLCLRAWDSNLSYTKPRQEKLAAAKQQAQADGPPAFVPVEEREREEDARIAELQMKGKMMMNYGWPKAVRACTVLVCIDVPGSMTP